MLPVYLLELLAFKNFNLLAFNILSLRPNFKYVPIQILNIISVLILSIFTCCTDDGLWENDRFDGLRPKSGDPHCSGN